MLIGECPGVMAMAARQFVITSEDRGHPYCQFYGSILVLIFKYIAYSIFNSGDCIAQ
jgi:hypothetical protein